MSQVRRPFAACALVVCLSSCGPPGQDAPSAGLYGRWDLTVSDSVETWPGWLELTDGPIATGRFQPRGGHALAVEDLVVEGGRIAFGIADVELHFEASLNGDVLQGTLSNRQGGPFSVRGVRAPSLVRDTLPAWGEEIDLLADGLGGWTIREEPNGWSFRDQELINTMPSRDLITRQRFTDFRLHLEVNVPPRGNSGIYLRGRHEVQVQDDYGNEPQNRRMGGIYGQVTPTVLPARPAGEWQTFDITLIGRRVTVVLNGVTMIDAAEIPGITGGALDSDEGSPGPIMLQGDHSDVRYRNIRITPARSD